MTAPDPFWYDQLNETKSLLLDLNRAIRALSLNEIKSFSINTGQTTQNVTRQDLPALLQSRERVIKQILDLESLLGIGTGAEPRTPVQVVPW
ncbi:hypothetical protein FACS1894164_11110 [Spirochaetia bacterium]|nr:hypothetical protein FACS1894164_11110 [Spirochaetia bacterium]